MTNQGGTILKLLKRKRKLSIRIRTVISCLYLVLLPLSGCKEREDLNIYRTNMEQFFENVKNFNASINALDPESETAVSDLLGLLDSMQQCFSEMAGWEVPEDFAGVEQLADEADEYMSEAVLLYHQAFEGETYSAALADTAKHNYDRANQRIQYILSILHGEIPESIFSYEQPDE